MGQLQDIIFFRAFLYRVLLTGGILAFSISAVANRCMDEFQKLYGNEAKGTEIVLATEPVSTAVSLPTGIYQIETNKKGFSDRQELMNLVLGNIATLLEQVSPEAQRTYLKLFGENGLFLNSDFTMTMIDALDADLKSEIRSISVGDEPLESDLVGRIVEAVSKRIHSLYIVNSSSKLEKYYNQRSLKKSKSGLRKRALKKFFEGLSGEGESDRDFESTGKNFYADLIRQAVFFSILELNFLNQSRLTAYEEAVLYRAGKKDQKPGYSDVDAPEATSYFWKPVGHTVMSGVLLLGEFVVPGSSLVTIPAQQAYFKSSPVRAYLERPFRKLLKRRKLKNLVASIEPRLKDGGFTVASPRTLERTSQGLAPIQIGQGEHNGVHDPVQLEIPEHLKYSTEAFIAEYEEVKGDEKSVERLINLTVDKFGLKMNLALAQSEFEDKDFFGLWDQLESLKTQDQYRKHFRHLRKRKEAYEVLKARSDYLWAQRAIVVQVLSEVDDFRQVLFNLLGEANAESLIEVIDDRVRNYSSFKDDFETNSEELLKIARGILDESFEEARDLVHEDDNRGFRIRLLPRHHRGTGTDLVPSGQNDDLVIAQVIEVMRHPAFENYVNRDDLSRNFEGSSDTYTHPTLGGYPIVVDQADSRVLKALCKDLGKAAELKGIRGHLRTTFRDSYSGPVAKIQSYKRWGNKYEVIVETVEASDRVVYELKCY